MLALGAICLGADNLPLDVDVLARATSGDLRDMVERYSSDRTVLEGFYDHPLSLARSRKLKEFFESWKSALEGVRFDGLNQNGKVDYLLFRNELDDQLRRLRLAESRREEMLPLMPFLDSIVGLHERRQHVDPIDPRKVAEVLVQAERTIGEVSAKAAKLGIRKSVANRASLAVNELRKTVKSWFEFYNGYDPLFTWWVDSPYKKFDESLKSYATKLREEVAGVKADDKDTIVGDPVGRQALLEDLAAEFVPYTPEELVRIANLEFAWCEAEMKKASREMGYGDDWKRALEHVKTLSVPPGGQTALVRDLAEEAIAFVEKNQLVTVPPLAGDTWRMFMMAPEQQRINPFFLGGDSIIVSYPANTMTHGEKMMSMRGNNIHFARATVFHELIPGHRLQYFMSSRYRAYRQVFRTPFWTEGWALYWEMVFWDKGFPLTPENRVGMLFWRMHRCARIIFSLSFHLEKMSAQECVNYLVERVGHERENAAAEVRRSFETDYPPLYQAAYMLGALQFRALRKELVDSKRMTDLEFHDAILKLNSIPVEMIRATLTDQPLTREFRTNWKFYGDIK